jgi:hypothetical protein
MGCLVDEGVDLLITRPNCRPTIDRRNPPRSVLGGKAVLAQIERREMVAQIPASEARSLPSWGARGPIHSPSADKILPAFHHACYQRDINTV